MEDKHIPYLIVRLYYLYYVDDIAQLMSAKINIVRLRIQYDADTIRRVAESLEWAAFMRFLEQLKDV